MKAIVVFDMPENCWECPCGELWECRLDPSRDIGEEATPFDKRMDWCPLKPMPEKKVVTVKRIEDIQSYSITEVADKISAKIILKTNEVFALGWNACLDSIRGENNESNEEIQK